MRMVFLAWEYWCPLYAWPCRRCPWLSYVPPHACVWPTPTLTGGKFLITLEYACPSSHKAALLADILDAASSARDATAVLALPSPATQWVKANNDLTKQCVVEQVGFEILRSGLCLSSAFPRCCAEVPRAKQDSWRRATVIPLHPLCPSPAIRSPPHATPFSFPCHTSPSPSHATHLC